MLSLSTALQTCSSAPAFDKLHVTKQFQNFSTRFLSSAWFVSAHKHTRTMLTKWERIKKLWAESDGKKSEECRSSSTFYSSHPACQWSLCWGGTVSLTAGIDPIWVCSVWQLWYLFLYNLALPCQTKVCMCAAGWGLWMLVQSTWRTSGGCRPLASTGARC